ncbi:MAG: peptidylprolyl isomerase, partial [Bacteroidales bacterium]|nr:peptidylprolyl isomerase [Bacteroidales bacterium]
MKKLLLILCVFLGMAAQAQDKETKVLIKTNYGDITVMLYNDTPQHRDNFIKLVNDGWFTGSPFHRVIKNFMI